MKDQLERWRRSFSSALSSRRASADAPDPEGAREGHPIVAGIAALLAVGLVVGAILGGVAWAGARVLGVGETATAAAGPTSGGGDSLYLPKPSQTEEPTEPLLTLAPEPGRRGGGGGGGGGSSAGDEPSKKRKKKQAEDQIALSAGQTETSVMGQIDLTGTFADGEGSVLQVQRFEAGSWTNFDATVAVANGTFSTFVQSGQVGVNRFRVLDTDSGQASNDVRVTVN